MSKSNQSSAGKGDKPRNCFSRKFKENYEEINWGEKTKKDVDKESKFIKIYK